MISIVITSFNEPKTIGKAIESFLIQDIKDKFELYVAAPDEETLNIARQFQKKNKSKNIKLFKDPGKGKSHALNLILQKLKGDIFIFTDGDVYVSDNSVNEIIEKFKDKKVGCVSGRVVSQNNRNNLYGYWSHLLCYAAHKLREKRNLKDEFLECSGYLWAFKKGIIKRFPVHIAEDTIVPIFFWLNCYKIKYASNALVFVKFPVNLEDFLKQKIRAAASHGTIFRYVNPNKIPRMKSLKNEILESCHLFNYPRNIKEFIYTFQLFPIRLYIWLNLYFNQKIRNKYYTDAWKRAESTK